MLDKVVVLYDERVEISTKYKKALENSHSATVEVVKSFDELKQIIVDVEPELILISDSVAQKLDDVCAVVRSDLSKFRPIIVAISKSGYVQDRLDALNSGADDFLSEPIEINEFVARINAHLRRQNEETSNLVTNLSLSVKTYKVLRRIMHSNSDWALLFIDIDNYHSYREIYGEIAADKMMQAYSAILKSVVSGEDFVGQIDEDNFLIITSSLKADKMADYLNMAFDSVSSRFYNEEDAQRGYIILQGDNKAGRRTSLVSTSIGIISTEHKTYNDYKEALNAVRSVQELAKSIPGSSKLTDRPQICGADCVIDSNQPKKILIAEPDAAMAYLLSTTFEMQNFQTEAITNFDEIIDKIPLYKPNIILIDAGAENHKKALEICSKLKSINEFSCIKIIVTTVVHNKENVLDAGADLYLPKPYELTTLFNWVEKLMVC